jgi:hypothetical protein
MIKGRPTPDGMVPPPKNGDTQGIEIQPGPVLSGTGERLDPSD